MGFRGVSPSILLKLGLASSVPNFLAYLVSYEIFLEFKYKDGLLFKKSTITIYYGLLRFFH